MKSLWATGQEPQLALRPLLETLAREPARSDGDARLDLLVAGAFRILRRIEERGDTGFLIVLERELPRDRRREQQRQAEDAEDAHLHPGEIGDREEHRQQRHRRAEVRFLGDQVRTAGSVSTPPMARSVHVGAPRFSPKNLASTSATPTLANSDGCRLKPAERDPAARAHLHVAEEQDVEQQREQPDVDEVRLVGEGAVVERQHEHHRAQAEDDGVELRDVQARHRAGRIRGRAVDHRDAERAEREDGDQQRPVDVVVEASFEHRLLSAVAPSSATRRG